MSTTTQTLYATALVQKKEIARNLLELRFQKPEGFSFAAGQFIQFRGPDGDKIVLRSFSVSSSPADPYLEFCAKILPEGKASGFFFELTEGSSVEFQGPAGRFTNTSAAPLTCVATGAGLAPIMSILRDELEHKKNQASLDLLFGVREEQNVFWTDRLEALKAQFLNFNYILTLSRPTDAWTGATGRVTAHMGNFIHPSREYYLCGNGDMVKEVRQMVMSAGIAQEKIHFEIF